MNTREGGLRNIGSTNQRAAISQRQNSSAMTATRATHGRRIARRNAIALLAITSAFPALRARTRRY
jgi:hypothetical protein